MTLAVVMLTYSPSVESPRHTYAKMTWLSLRKHLKYSGDLQFHIADDGSPIEHIYGIQDLEDFKFSVTDSCRRGYGANYNTATQSLHYRSDYMLMIEDDWELTRPLDLDPLIAALDEGLDCIRLGYLGWTQEVTGSLKKFSDQTYFVFDNDMPEPHVWAGHPRIETVAFQRSVGPWPEGLNPGSTEFEVATRVKEIGATVGWPLDLGVNASQQHASLFAHIGAVQAREDQK